MHDWQKEVTTPSFINPQEIESALYEAQNPSREWILDILQKLKSYQKDPSMRLSLKEAAALLQIQDSQTIDEIFKEAKRMKQEVYGNRVVLFAPLYLGNKCTNLCTYCGFNALNTKMERMTLEMGQLEKEVLALEKRGHKRLILVYGTHPDYSVDYMVESIRKVYETSSEKTGEIRRVNINASPLSVEDFKKVHDAGIGTYQIFQETYHEASYAKAHPSGEKSNYKWRLFGLDRAQEAGIDDVGLGVLFGLYDWKFDTLALLEHTYYLEDKFGVGPHTLSFPRIKKASGVNMKFPHAVDDEDFKRIIAVLRLAVPYTGLILTAREDANLRKECLHLGVSQIDAGTQIELDSYSSKDSSQKQNLDKEQFEIGDTRSLDEIIYDLVENDFVPSFCTACYRAGRTGEHFMEFSKPGFIHEFCTPNSLFTLQEYLRDYGSDKTIKAGSALIDRAMANLKSQFHTKEQFEKDMKRVLDGENDLYY